MPMVAMRGYPEALQAAPQDVDLARGRAIDDPGTAQPSHEADQGAQPGVALTLERLEREIRAVR